MYEKPRANVERWRLRKGHGAYNSDRSYGNNGMFVIPYTRDIWMRCIVSDGGGWEHVSVHAVDREGNSLGRTPSWEEMCFVRDLFWRPDELVIQIHPPHQEYVNIAEYVLHLWRPVDEKLPKPELYMV
jgi:hypothetical protein